MRYRVRGRLTNTYRNYVVPSIHQAVGYVGRGTFGHVMLTHS